MQIDNFSNHEIQENDFVAYPIHENTKNQRLTIAQVSNTGISLWVEGPEISTTVTQIGKCIYLGSQNKKTSKIYKKYCDKMNKLDIDDLGFETYQEKANTIFETFVEKFKEVRT